MDIDLTGTEDYNYDEWLEFFKKIPASKLIESKDYLEQTISVEGYAALMRWLEIIEDPTKMDKLYKGRLDKQEEVNVLDLAVGDDDEKFYEALIRQNTEQLSSSGVSPQEVARLSQNINIFRKELREIRSRRPKSGSTLEKVLEAAMKPKKATSVKPVKPAQKRARATKSKKTTSRSSTTKK
jgi:hypothetical protein|nr:MAG TPA: hypothetical protein [Caudoviricetes sp.]